VEIEIVCKECGASIDGDPVTKYGYVKLEVERCACQDDDKYHEGFTEAEREGEATAENLESDLRELKADLEQQIADLHAELSSNVYMVEQPDGSSIRDHGAKMLSITE
jgi:hypothetical protein